MGYLFVRTCRGGVRSAAADRNRLNVIAPVNVLSRQQMPLQTSVIKFYFLLVRAETGEHRECLTFCVCIVFLRYVLYRFATRRPVGDWRRRWQCCRSGNGPYRVMYRESFTLFSLLFSSQIHILNTPKTVTVGCR